MKIKCGSVYCNYSLPKLEFTNGHQVSWPKTKLTKTGGFFCTDTAMLQPTSYELAGPGNVFPTVPKSPPPATTGLCSSVVELYCEPANLYPQGTVLQGEASEFKINGEGFLHIECKNASASMKTMAAYAQPLGMEKTTLAEANCVMPFTECSVSTSPYQSSVTGSPSGGIWKGEHTFHTAQIR